ncbi:MAG: hypothetical protein JO353_00600, partial [Phycisphaerae bacterium]|nr:hypothetical protein [Phycisphaerae bacterium]
MRFRPAGKLLMLILFALGASPALAANHASLAANLNRSDDSKSATIELTLTIDPGFHAQSHTPLDKNLIPLTVMMDDLPGVTFDPPTYPSPMIDNSPVLGTQSVYTGTIKITIDAHLSANPPANFAGTLRYQACNANACSPPAKLSFSVATGAGSKITTTTQATAAAPPMVAPPIRILGHDLNHDAYLFAFAAAFVVGIIFNVMPCVLPVVPLKIMGFYEVSQHDRGKSLALGAVFSAGLIASFAVLGILIAALHVISWGGLFQKTWFTAAIVAVLVIMSFSLFGAFSVGLPSGIYRFAPRHDTYSGNFLFGILTAALSTPCTFGMFVGLLAWALSQPAVIGVELIMMVGVGMAAPYFVLSAFPQLAKNFPRTGAWADVVKQMMGFLLLATAVYFAQPLLERFVSEDSFWWAMFAVISIGGVFLIARSIQLSPRPTPRIVAAII